MAAIPVIFGIAAVVLIAITVTTFVQVRLMSKPSLVPSPDKEPPPDANEWAQNNDFEFVGNFTMKVGPMNTFISAWRRYDRPTFFCQYIIRSKDSVKRAYDLVTEFAFNISLTTGDTRDSVFFPHPPGSYMQTFSNTSFDDRWYKHIEMENYLVDNGQAQLVQIDKPLEKCFVDAILEQMKFVQSIPLWPFRAPYWYFIRKSLWHNKSIKIQHEKGMINLPNELSGIELITPISSEDQLQD